MTEETKELSLREEIEQAAKGEPTPEAVTDPADAVVADPAVAELAPEEPEIPVPASLSAVVKEKWKELPAELRTEWAKREEEVHKGFTRHDEERNFGRTIKEAATPYIPIIQAEGGTVEGAFKDLLNTAYILRTGSPQQKAQLVAETCRQFGVDIAALGEQQEYVDPTITQLQAEIAQLKQLASPDYIQKQLQTAQETANINNEVQAFASDPANVYYQQVKHIMASLLGSGQAANLKEAYEAACYANPQVRSTLIQQQTAELKAKQKAEIDAKRHAASSITGSPSVANAGNSTTPNNNDLRTELELAFATQRGLI